MFGLKKRLGDLLVDAEKMTKKQFKGVFSKQRSTDEKLGQPLILKTFNFENVKNAPVVNLVDSIFSNIIKSRASDKHIEPFETYLGNSIVNKGV
ncbi:MAG: type II secretory ATPase GspE/PulE/Tfp pilus assembly ATPase PilB-like protein [Clostridium sp.]|jgi:type II secretory ATPase GspE/PulE/Tfp pilus assembly ATPase PilB-like protein